MAIHTVVFDVGETLIDEQPMWAAWADWIGEPQESFFAALRGVIARREHHQRVFEILRPGFDFAAQRAQRVAAGDPSRFDAAAMFVDVGPCFAWAKAAGLRIGIAGNTSSTVEAMLRDAGTPADFIGSSQSFGVEKPAGEFFARLVALAGCRAHEIAYVGDRLDNDVLPAARAGMHGIFLRRGLWADVHRHWPEAAQVADAIDSLAQLPAVIPELIALTTDR